MTPLDELQADEYRRAALWRAQVNRRVEFQARLWASLSGDPDAHWRQVRNWSPLMGTATFEDAPEDDPGFDPLGISDTVNVGT